MHAVLEEAISAHSLPLTILLGLVALYWIASLIGLMDFDALERAVQPGGTVLLLGTGGVSIWALQLARAAGCRVIITSSSDEKLEKARALGANETINYSRTPEWSAEVRRLTGGEGVDLVLEVGGEKTLPQSLAAVRLQGTVVTIGAVSGSGGGIPPRALIPGAVALIRARVGSPAA